MSEARRRRNPYVGPRAFRSGEKLYGRDGEVVKLLNLLIAERIVLLHSPSGAGKTSLIQAELIPRLKKQNFQVQPIIRVSRRPPSTLIEGRYAGTEQAGGPPMNRYLVSTLLSLDKGPGQLNQATIATDEPFEIGALDYLSGKLKALEQHDLPESAQPARAVKQVLIFDQFEEILTVDAIDRAGKIAFFQQVGEALRERHRWALFAMREDYLGALEPYLRYLPTRLRTTFRLDLLGLAAAREAVRQPASRAGKEFSDQALKRLIGDLCKIKVQRLDGEIVEEQGLTIEPVQLQVVCHRLWELLPPETTPIEPEHIDTMVTQIQRKQKIGSIDAALADYYATMVKAVARKTKVPERDIREWFDTKLITKLGIRGLVDQSQALDRKVIQALVDAHLVREESRHSSRWFELAHDRLIVPVQADNEWWREQNLSKLQQRVVLWLREEKSDSQLMSGAELLKAEGWAATHKSTVTDEDREFLHRSQERRARRYVFIAQALAAQALRQQRRAQPDELVALLARQAYLFDLRSGGQVFDQVDEALRAALDKRDFSAILPGRYGSVLALAFSPDGALLAAGGEGRTVRLWDVRRPGQAARPLSGSPGGILALAFSPDGALLAAGGEDKTVRLWDIRQSQPEPLSLRGHEGAVLSVAFSPDGAWLASGSRDGSIRLWSLPKREEPPRVLADAATEAILPEITSVAFCSDGTVLVASSYDKSRNIGVIRAWDMRASSPRSRVLASDENRVNTIATGATGSLLAAGYRSGEVVLWDLRNMRAFPRLLGRHDGGVNAVCFSPDGQSLVSGGWDKIALWDTLRPAEPTILYVAEPGASAITGTEGAGINALAFSPDGRSLASGSVAETVRLWDAPKGRDEPIAPGGEVKRDDLVSHTRLGGHEGGVRSVAFSAQGQQLASGGADGCVRLWKIGGADTEPQTLSSAEGKVAALAFSPRGDLLAWTSAGATIQLWRRSQPDKFDTLLGGKTAFRSLAFNRDGTQLAAAGEDGLIYLWELSLSAAPPRLLGQDVPGFAALAVAFSPDGRLLASGGTDNTTRLWDLSRPKAAPTIVGEHRGAVLAVAFSPDGKLLASGGQDNAVGVWELARPGGAPKLLEEHHGAVLAVAFSPDGALLATGSEDRTIRLYAPYQLYAPQQRVASVILDGHRGAVASVAFNPRGKTLASGSQDGSVRLWALTELLAELVCRKVWRNLTREEWRQFVGPAAEIPYEPSCPDIPTIEMQTF